MAPSAVTLYSAFYDMSARMIRNFALDPGKAPNSFTFNAVATNKEDAPPVAPMFPQVPPFRPNPPFKKPR